MARRLMHVITDLNIGGAETMLYRLLAAGRHEPFEPCVVSLMDPGPLAVQFDRLGIPIHGLGMPRRLPSPASLARLRRQYRDVRPDLVQGWMYHGNLAATIAGWPNRHVPVVWNVRHSVSDLALERRLTQAIIRLSARLSRRPAAIVYNSRVSARQHERLGFAPERTKVIPNGFDGERFRPRPERRRWLRTTLGIDPGATIIGMVGRNHPMKDPGNLIQAVGALRRAGQAVHLVIVGSGFDAANTALLAAAQAVGLDRCLSLLGERHDVPTLVAGFDVVALPSAYGEGFPNVLGEAMACGVPCVATDVGDAAWVVGDHGIIVPPRSPDALAAALGSLLDLGAQGRRQLGLAARRRVLEQFSINDVVGQYHALYQRCGGTPGAGEAGLTPEENDRVRHRRPA